MFTDDLRESTAAALALNVLKHAVPPNRWPPPLDQQQLPPPQAAAPDDSNIPPEIPPVRALQGLIGRCSKPFEKQLTPSDVKDNQNRLNLGKAEAEGLLLPMLNQDEDVTQGINVTTYDIDGNEYPMVFKLWASKVYVLNGGWKEFYHRRGYKEYEDFVTVWMFRNIMTGRLCFVISSRRLPVYETIKVNKKKRLL